MKTIIKLFLFFIIISSSANLFAGDKIRIKLHQPPPNKMPVSSLWQMDIENTTRENVTIYLVGTVNGDRLGEIVGGKSKPFSVKPGKSTYGYDDFKSGEVKWVNKSIQEIIFRTGEVPEDNYTVCVTAYYEDGNTADQENCITQQVQQLGVISLISPSDNEVIDPDTLPGLVFSWTPLPAGGPYSLKIVELKGDQSPDVALISNRPILDLNDIKTTTYNAGDPIHGVDIKLGMKYAWQVSVGNVKSDIHTFSMMQSQYQVIIDTVIMRCDSLKPNCYSYQVKVRNNNPVGSPGPTNTSQATIVSTSPIAASITPSIGSLTPGIVYPGTYTISGTICFSSAPGTVSFSVKMQDNTNPASYNGTTTYTVNIPFCCVPITTLPTMVGWWTFDETSGTTFFDRAGFNNEGSQVNTLGFITGKVAGALDFTNGYVSVPTHADMNVFVCDSLSIDAWIKTTGSSTYAIVEKREMTTCGQPVGYSFFLQNGKLGFQTSNGVTFSNILTPALTPAINNGNWQHVAVTMNRNPTNSTIRFYRDGVLVQTSPTSGLVGGLQNGSPLLIGCITPGMVFGGTTFPGGIDEVEIFKRVLTQPQINSIFSAQGFGKCKQ